MVIVKNGWSKKYRNGFIQFDKGIQSLSIFIGMGYQVIQIWKNRNNSPVIRREFKNRTSALNYAKHYLANH